MQWGTVKEICTNTGMQSRNTRIARCIYLGFVDQGLWNPAHTGFLYGGDWGDNPNDADFCANGL